MGPFLHSILYSANWMRSITTYPASLRCTRVWHYMDHSPKRSFPFRFSDNILCAVVVSSICRVYLPHWLPKYIRRKAQIAELILGPKIVVSTFLSNTLKLCYVSSDDKLRFTSMWSNRQVGIFGLRIGAPGIFLLTRYDPSSLGDWCPAFRDSLVVSS